MLTRSSFHSLQENVFFVIYVLMSTFYFYLTVLLVPIVALFGDFIYLGWDLVVARIAPCILNEPIAFSDSCSFMDIFLLFQLFVWTQDSEMVLPLRLSDCSGNSQARAWWQHQCRITGSWEPAYTAGGREPITTRDIKTHWLCFWFTWIRVIFRRAARYICPSEGMGCGS